MRDMDKNTLLVVFAGACIVAAFVLFGLAFYQRTQVVNEANQRICVAVNNINTVITQTLRRSLANVPRLSYYKQHPDELAQQEAEIRREIRRFKPRTCG